MPENVRFRVPLMLLAGGVTLGCVLGATTPTRMMGAPEPSWRLPTAQRINVAEKDQAASVQYFSASTYEVYPAERWLHGYNEEAVPTAGARFADDYDWRMNDAHGDASADDRAVDPSDGYTAAIDDVDQPRGPGISGDSDGEPADTLTADDAPMHAGPA